MITAVIGIGSNSIRMLVADVDGTTARRVLRDREGTRLFAGLDANRTLSEESMTRTADAAARMAAKARALGAGEVRLFATSATRDAANADVFVALLRGKADLELEICSGEEEASLSFLGATDGGYAGVIDIGGGSTEYVVGENERIDCAFSCQMGAVRLFGMQPIRSSADLPAVEQMADNILTEQLSIHPILRMPEHWTGTGGTFTTLAAMVRRIPWTERTYMHGTLLERDTVRQLARDLADMPMEQRLQLPGLQPNRADIVVHGICILTASMDRLEIPVIRVSEYGNLDGYLKRCFALTELINPTIGAT